MVLPQPSLAQLRPALNLALDTAASAAPGRALPGRVRNLVRSRRLPANWAVTMVQALGEDEAFRSWVAEEASEESLGRVAWLWLARPEGWADELAGLVEEVAATEEMDKEVRLASERADALERELAAVREELTRARDAQSALAADAEEQRKAAARAEAGRRAELSSAVEQRDARLAQMATARSELEAERDDLAARVHELESRLAESERARQDAEAEVAGLEAGLESVGHERDALRDGAERRRTSVAGAVERAAVAAGELGAALAAAAAALAPDPPSGGTSTPTEGAQPADRQLAVGPADRQLAAAPAPAEPAPTAKVARRSGRGPGRRPWNLPLGVFEDSPEAAAFLVKVPGVHLVVDGYNVALTSWAPAAPPEPAGRSRPPVTDLPALRRRLVDALGELAVRVQRSVTVVFDGQDEGGRASASGPARPWLRVVFSPSSVEADAVILDAVRRLRPEVPVVVATNDREVRDGARDLGANVISVGQLLAVLNRRTSA